MEVSVIIAQPIEKIWSYISNLDNEKHWRKGVIESLWNVGEPLGVGSAGLDIIRPFGEVPWKITDWEEQHLLGCDFIGGKLTGGHGSYLIEPVNGGARMTLCVKIKAGILFRSFIKPFFTHQLSADLKKLKAIMEHS